MTIYWRPALALIAATSFVTVSEAANVASFSPQGEVTQISQVRVQFSEQIGRAHV